MNPLDASGNILNKGDYVALHMGTLVLKARVAEIKESSILMAKANEMLPGTISFMIPITLVFSVATPRLNDVYKLVKPPNLDDPELPSNNA